MLSWSDLAIVFGIKNVEPGFSKEFFRELYRKISGRDDFSYENFAKVLGFEFNLEKVFKKYLGDKYVVDSILGVVVSTSEFFNELVALGYTDCLYAHFFPVELARWWKGSPDLSYLDFCCDYELLLPQDGILGGELDWEGDGYYGFISFLYEDDISQYIGYIDSRLQELNRLFHFSSNFIKTLKACVNKYAGYGPPYFIDFFCRKLVHLRKLDRPMTSEEWDRYSSRMGSDASLACVFYRFHILAHALGLSVYDWEIVDAVDFNDNPYCAICGTIWQSW